MDINAFLRGSWGAQRLLSSSSVFRAKAMLGYGISVVAFLIALALRFSLDGTLPPGFPFLTFIPAVIISAFIAGPRAGGLCAGLSFLAVWYWFLGGQQPFSLTFGAALALGFFTFIAVVDIALIEAAARSVNLLRAQQAQLNTIVETVPLGLVLAEFPSGTIVGQNKYLEKMFGHPFGQPSDINSFGQWVGFHEDGSLVEGHEYPLAAMMLRGEENPSLEIQFERCDGSKTWLHMVGRPVRDIQGNITGGVLAIIDIDEEKATKKHLEEALKTKELLLYEVNHRVKNSLHLVSSFLFLESLKIKESEAQSAVMTARDKVGLIARVHQLLYESGTHNRVDMRSAIDEIANDLMISAGRSDVALEKIFSGDLMIDISQASPLVLVINEIVTNSLKYGLNSKYPKLIFSVSKEGDNLAISISDNGPGISFKETKKKIGVGSQIIEGLVHQMRGAIDIQTTSSGTTVFLTIPTHTKVSSTRGR